MDPCPQREVEDHRTVFDEQAAVAVATDRHRDVVGAGEPRQDAVVGVSRGGDHQGERGTPVGVDAAQRRCAIGSHRDEADAVTGRHLAELPAVAAYDGDRADEAAQAGPVRPEQDRGVAGEVQSADTVGIVVNVRRVQPGLTAVGPGPLWLGAFQAYAGAVGVEVHGVVGVDQGVDVGAGEELRRRVRAFGDRDLPAMADSGLLVDGGAGGPARDRTGVVPGGQLVAFAQRPPTVAAERAEGEGGCAA